MNTPANPSSETAAAGGIVYVLTNPAMPGFVKIGLTTDIERRVRELSASTSIPIPFEVYYACTVGNMKKVENGIHEGFGNYRVNPRREFFKVDPERIVAILKLVEIEDITPDKDYVEDAAEQLSLNKERKPLFKFSMVNIPQGAVLTYIRDESITATVFDDRKIKLRGEIYYLTTATKMLLKEATGKTYPVISGPSNWLYENETLNERRYRIENEDTDE